MRTTFPTNAQPLQLLPPEPVVVAVAVYSRFAMSACCSFPPLQSDVRCRPYSSPMDEFAHNLHLSVLPVLCLALREAAGSLHMESCSAATMPIQ